MKRTHGIRALRTESIAAGPLGAGVILEIEMVPAPDDAGSTNAVSLFLTIEQSRDLTQHIATRLTEVAAHLQAQLPKARH